MYRGTGHLGEREIEEERHVERRVPAAAGPLVALLDRVELAPFGATRPSQRRAT
jgi:hypothetical protein